MPFQDAQRGLQQFKNQQLFSIIIFWVYDPLGCDAGTATPKYIVFEPEDGTSIAVLDEVAESCVPVYDACVMALHSVLETPKLLLPEAQLLPYTYI